jgi:zona occludens toxin
MSIKIYWGSNGSYKSASAVQDDIIPELLKGRVVVTNIRGCTLERCVEQYPDIPDSADIIHVDTAKAGGLDRLQTWFRWVPKGALIVLDEVQLIHRKAWREKDLERFIYRVTDEFGNSRFATFDEAERDNTPFDMLDAFTRHRHFNWDLVLTTPNIKYIRDDIRGTCETAYRQANGALLGSFFKGKFKRAMHDADDNKPGTGALTQTLSINPKVFKCYDSTATGKAQDTRAGTNIFKSPRLLLSLACAIGGFAYAFSSGGIDNIVDGPDKAALGLSDAKADIAVSGASSSISALRPDAPVAVTSSRVSSKQGRDVRPDDALIAVDVFSDFDASLTYMEGYGRSYEYFLIEFDHWGKDGQPFSIDSGELLRIGYRYKVLTDCSVLLYTDKSTRLVTCWKPRPKVEKKERDEDYGQVAMQHAGAAAETP